MESFLYIFSIILTISVIYVVVYFASKEAFIAANKEIAKKEKKEEGAKIKGIDIAILLLIISLVVAFVLFLGTV